MHSEKYLSNESKEKNSFFPDIEKLKEFSTKASVILDMLKVPQAEGKQ
jgi:hypothetical protein